MGPSAFGAMGYPMVDVKYANCVIAITDCLAPVAFPSIPAEQVDWVVQVDAIGDNTQIATDSTRETHNPMDLNVAKKAFQALVASGYVRDGFAFQAGSGAISLAMIRFLADYMKASQITAKFAMAG